MLLQGKVSGVLTVPFHFHSLWRTQQCDKIMKAGLGLVFPRSNRKEIQHAEGKESLCMVLSLALLYA